MNQINHYIFDLYHYLLNLRDTLEYVIERDHQEALYTQRKNVLTQGLLETAPLGNFFKRNEEQSAELKKNLEEFVEEIYGDDSTILKLAEGKVRVDHTQHIALIDKICGLQESVRDIIYGHMNFANQSHELDPLVAEVIEADDKLYRLVITMFAMREMEKSFAEFQKVMGESGGKETPQSNFIAQNEILVLAKAVRFSREHHHCKENEILDALDQACALIEMVEGRRERRDNKNFGDLFKDVRETLNPLVSKYENAWREKFQKTVQEVIASNKKRQEEAEEQAKKA